MGFFLRIVMHNTVMALPGKNNFCFHFQTFRKLNFPAFTLEIEHRDDCNQIQAVLGEMTGATSVSNLTKCE